MKDPGKDLCLKRVRLQRLQESIGRDLDKSELCNRTVDERKVSFLSSEKKVGKIEP